MGRQINVDRICTEFFGSLNEAKSVIPSAIPFRKNAHRLARTDLAKDKLLLKKFQPFFDLVRLCASSSPVVLVAISETSRTLGLTGSGQKTQDRLLKGGRLFHVTYMPGIGNNCEFSIRNFLGEPEATFNRNYLIRLSH